MDESVKSDQESQPLSNSVSLDEDPFKSTSRVENSEFVDALENNSDIVSNADNLTQLNEESCESKPTTDENVHVERLADRLNKDLETGTPVDRTCDVKNHGSCDLDRRTAASSSASIDNNDKRTDSEKDNSPGEDNSCSEAGSDEEEAYHSAEEGDNIVIDETYLKEIEDTLTEEEKNDRRKEAQALKETGNGLFKAGEYREAVKAYKKALKLCPLSFAKDRSIMYSNRAACFMRMDDVDQAIADSSKAIELNPQYLKAVLRRAELYEKGDKLDEALADYQRVIELDPGNHLARAACMRLPDQIKERNEKMKEEMLGKLKDLGNMILKPFGLSTNNFQLQQDPNTGGYSVQFNNNGK